jgi:hypothetical protein
MGDRVEGAVSTDGAVQILEPEGDAAALSLEDYLPAPAPLAPAQPVAPGMRTARVAGITGRRATISFRGASTPVDAAIAPEVDTEVVTGAWKNGDSVLVEVADGETPLIVAALQTRLAREIHLKAATIVIEGEQEVLLRSGRAAVRIREDGDIEVVGSRISAASRGLFRIVGRILRLN